MSSKKRSSPDDKAGKKAKQSTISFNNSGRSARSAELIWEQKTELTQLPAAVCHELQRASEIYLKNWSDKCEPRRGQPAGLRDDVDLDSAGMKFIEAFRHCLHHCKSRQQALDFKMVEVLVLVLRNDTIHQHTRVSRAAYTTLCAYLEAFPFAKLAYNPDDGGEYKGMPVLVTNEHSAWTPLSSESSNSLTRKYLSYKDMTIAGCKYKEERHPAQSSKRTGADRFGNALELILYCVRDGAVKSDENDYNGDLMLLRYLLTVIEQDLTCRLAIHSAYADHPDDAVQRKRQTLFQTSLAWRVFTSAATNSDQSMHHLVQGLFSLLVAVGGDAEDVEEESEDDDAPAAPCVFTQRELAGLAGRLLRCMLRLHGTAEGSGYFLSTSKHRAQSAGGFKLGNQRMELDRLMLRFLWHENAVCRTAEDFKAVFRVLEPRDALRLLGQLLATRFAKTWDREAKGGLNVLLDADLMLNAQRGEDAYCFFEVDMVAAVASLNLDPARALKTYRSADWLAALLSCVATAARALTAAGEPVPCGDAGVDALWENLDKAIRFVVEKGGKDAILTGVKADLVLAEMTITAARA